MQTGDTEYPGKSPVINLLKINEHRFEETEWSRLTVPIHGPGIHPVLCLNKSLEGLATSDPPTSITLAYEALYNTKHTNT